MLFSACILIATKGMNEIDSIACATLFFKEIIKKKKKGNVGCIEGAKILF